MTSDEAGPSLAPGTFQFAGYTLDIAQGSLLAADHEVELRHKAFEVLRFLVENADRIVTKDELIQAVWPNVVVTDDVLTHCISEVRNAIGDNRQSIIRTMPRRGYRFAAAVAEVAANGTPASKLPPPSSLQAGGRSHGDEKVALSLPELPSIAVLPFQNMSGDIEQEYFADGVVEEIITALSRFSGLFVIARNSSFTYKGRSVDIKQVGRELGVRYVLEGSVRPGGDRVRITGQLIDTATGAHLWADRFEGDAKALFELQDQVTTSVVGAIAPKLEQAEIERAKRKPTESLDAYDYYLKGMEKYCQNTNESISQAMRLFARAMELDNEFAGAYAFSAACYTQRQASGWTTDRETEVAETARLARKAVALGKSDAVVLARAGHALAYVVHEFDAGRLFIDRALLLNPNFARAWSASGWLRVWIGDPDTSIRHFAQFKRLSPLDPIMPATLSGNAFAHFFAGRFDDACLLAEEALQERPNLHPGLRVCAVSHALAGRMDRARDAISRLRQVDPNLRVSNLGNLTPLQRPEDKARYAEAMRKAGLPE